MPRSPNHPRPTSRDSQSQLAPNHVLPIPQTYEAAPGVCRLGPDARIELHVADRGIERAVSTWCGTLSHPSSAAGKGALPVRGQTATIRVATDAQAAPGREGYRLSVRPDVVELVGGSPAGCFYGLQTLRQWARPDAHSLPCGTIIDWPAFETRGLLHDVTRGKVPTLHTLKRLVDQLALLKINQLQLYIEHAFVFSFEPEIGSASNGLTPDEVRELEGYCRDRFIQLVPALATFGHMGRVLSMPKYRHLAEVEGQKEWLDLGWPERMRGLTLDCVNPESHALIEAMWSDVLAAFSSPVANICGDEPWDLAAGKNRGRVPGGGKGELYVEHIQRTQAICTSRGRQTQLFSDVIRTYPHLVDRLDPGTTVLHWGYDDQADYDGTARLIEAGLDTVVCPGTSGWKRIINAIGLAERNIKAFAAAGARHGARGLINTDWGDHGHFNALACSWHGIALGAALAWRADHPTGGSFDDRLAGLLWGACDGSAFTRLRDASRVADPCETWRLLWTPLDEIVSDPTLPTLGQAEQMRRASQEAERWFDAWSPSPSQDLSDIEELGLACRFSRLAADKISWAHQARSAPTALAQARSVRTAWAEDLERAGQAYADCWRRRNKPSGLQDIVAALRRAIRDGAPHIRGLAAC